MREVIAAVALCCLGACTGGASRQASLPVPEPDWPAPVGEVVLRSTDATATEPQLDVGLVVFDPGLGESAAGDAPVFAEVRKAESVYIPVTLRRALELSGYWGVVRVLPQASESSAVMLSGTIVHADGSELVVDVRAEDAAGRVWFERRYRDQATAEDYPVPESGEPFRDLYHQIANDLASSRAALSTREVYALPELALLRFATVLAPEQFMNYLSVDEEGLLELQRLPAANDRMLRRVQRLQQQEFLFVDTVDEQYRDLVERFSPTYHLWRQYSHELARYETDYLERVGEREIQARRGTFAAMQQTYSTFRRAKMHEQDLQELAVGFDNEVTATVMDVDDRVFRLSGSLSEQFGEWRTILQRIFALESGGRAAY